MKINGKYFLVVVGGMEAFRLHDLFHILASFEIQTNMGFFEKICCSTRKCPLETLSMFPKFRHPAIAFNGHLQTMTLRKYLSYRKHGFVAQNPVKFNLIELKQIRH